MVGDLRLVCGSRFCVWMKSENFRASRTKKTGVFVPHHIPVALFGVELHCEPARIAFGVARTLFTAHSGEADEDLGLLARALEDLGFGPVSDIAGNVEKSVSAGPFGMDYSFRDALPVEVRHLFDQQQVLHQDRPARTRGEGILVIADRSAGGRGHCFSCAHVFNLRLQM
jgi:hypothetical protein